MGSSIVDLLNKTGEPLVGRKYAILLTPFSQQNNANRNPFLKLVRIF